MKNKKWFLLLSFFCSINFIYSQAVTIPSAYMLQKHLQTTDWQTGNIVNYSNIDFYSKLFGKDSNFYLKIPTTSIDTTGKTDVSDSINQYLSRAFSMSMDSFIITVLLPPGELLLKKTIRIPSGVYLKGYGADKTIFKCSVGENNACFEMKPAITKAIATMPLAKPIKKGEDDLYINKNIVDQYLANKTKPVFAAVVKLNDDDLITSSWAKGTVKEHFWLRKENPVASNYQIQASANSIISYYPWYKNQFASISLWGDGIMNSNKPFTLNYDTGTTNSEIQIYEYVKYAGLLCLGIERLDTTSSQTTNIVLTNAVQCIIKAVESKNCNFAHIELNNSFLNIIKRNHFQDGNDYGGGGKAYGILLQEGSSSNSVLDNVMHHLRHSILLQSGANNNVVIANYSYDPYWTEGSFPTDAAGDIVLHGNYPFANLFEFNVAQQVVIDDSHGKNGPFNIFHRNWLQNYGVTFSANNGSDSQVFTGNEITNTGFFKGLYLLQGTGHFDYGNKVRGNLQPSSTALSLTKSVSHLNFRGDYHRRTFSGFVIPDVIDIDNIPFGEPFSQTNKSITALQNKDTVPACFVDNQDRIYLAVENVNSNHEKNSFLYPNPTNGDINVKSTSKNGAELKVYDLNGKLLLHYQLTEPNTIINLPFKGLLIVTLLQDGVLSSQKLQVL